MQIGSAIALEECDVEMSSPMTRWESALFTSTSLEVAASIEPDQNGRTDAMKVSDAMVSNDVKCVSITGTERMPCTKRRRA